MLNLHKLKNSFFRKGLYPISLIPMDKNSIHPVFETHCDILQPLTKIFHPFQTIHVINRIPNSIAKFNNSYIAEVEGALAIAPTDFTKKYYDVKKSQSYINNEIHNKKLKKIIFQSKNAMKLQSKWMTREMEEISTYVTLVPPTIYKKNIKNLSHEKLQFLMITSKSILKGSFLIPKLVESILKVRNDFVINIISSEYIEIDEKYIKYVKFHLIKRLSLDEKRYFFNKSHCLINISPMDTLGSFLDSIWFNTPMITVEGQHANSYVINKKTGFIVKSPVFYYSDDLTKIFFNLKTDFKKYLLSLDINIWNQMFNQISNIIEDLTYTDIEKIINQQYNYSKKHFTVNKWLNSWNDIYKEL